MTLTEDGCSSSAVTMVLCNRKIVANRFKSIAPNNPDKWFFKCANNKCKFWKWKDQICKGCTTSNIQHNLSRHGDIGAKHEKWNRVEERFIDHLIHTDVENRRHLQFMRMLFVLAIVIHLFIILLSK